MSRRPGGRSTPQPAADAPESGSGTMVEMPWFMQAFDELYLELYAHRDQAEADRIIDWLARQVELRHRRVIDLGCGAGRHLRSLSRQGARPVGLDLSAALLRRATERGALVRADLRRLPLAAGRGDGAISMFTSLGYFDRMEENRAVLAEVARLLRPGGFWLIDFFNAPLVRRTLEPESLRRIGAYEVLERRRLDEAGERVVKEIVVRDAETRRRLRTYRESVALWDEPAWRAMLAAAGFSVPQVVGDYAGGAYSAASSPRLILLAMREESTPGAAGGEEDGELGQDGSRQDGT